MVTGSRDGDEVHIWNTSAGFGDSDNDMLSDYDEVIEYGSNPNLRDSDGDGHIDAYEVQTETDPNDPDSDDDGDSDYLEVSNQLDPNDPDDNCSTSQSGCSGSTPSSTTMPPLPPPPTAIGPRARANAGLTRNPDRPTQHGQSRSRRPRGRRRVSRPLKCRSKQPPSNSPKRPSSEQTGCAPWRCHTELLL